MHSNTPDTGTWLAADVGGTNTRCALLDHPNAAARKLLHYCNADYPDLAALLRAYSMDIGENWPKQAVLAVAAPMLGDEIRLINHDWAFNRTMLARELNFNFLSIINDFEAIGHGLLAFDGARRVTIGPEHTGATGNRAVLGAGTGLGVSGLVTDGKQRVVISGEGGHMTLAARNVAEERIIAEFRKTYGHCSAERVLSGSGIVELHRIMHGESLQSAKDIAKSSAPACRATMMQFFCFFADIAADLALTLGARGGLFIAGGIVPGNLQLLRQSSFRERFEDKGRYRDYLAAIPSYVITDPAPGITGLSAYIATL